MINAAGMAPCREGGESITEMAVHCSYRNKAVEKCRENGDITLMQYLDMQAEKVLSNNRLGALRSRDDFLARVKEITCERLGEKYASDIEKALEIGALSTADHHGSVYCSQSFQGDILYSVLMRKLGFTGSVLPIVTGGQVELGNVTYSRGICRYSSKDKKELLPFFRELDQDKMAINAQPIDSGMLAKFKKRFDDRTLDDICKVIYEDEKVQSKASFAEQTTVIGAELFKHIFKDEKVTIPAYLEVEELIRPILIKELSEENSILKKLLSDKNSLRKLNEITTSDGLSLAAQLFACSDEKGRKIFLHIDEDNRLVGSSMDGAEVSFLADHASLIELSDKRVIFPGLLMAAFLLVFERGFTWFGGMFQASYLSEWKNAVCELLCNTGFKDEADVIRRKDCSGYISGPMFALYRGDEFATTAGPVEMWDYNGGFDKIESLIMNTTLWDSHLIGLSEMYPDLFSKSERTEGWYGIIAEGVFQSFTENYIND